MLSDLTQITKVKPQVLHDDKKKTFVMGNRDKIKIKQHIGPGIKIADILSLRLLSKSVGF
jgi:hypothetical protein